MNRRVNIQSSSGEVRRYVLDYETGDIAFDYNVPMPPVEYFQAKITELREALAVMKSCVVCGASLMLNDLPPHCFDCLPDEEHVADWEEFLGQR